MHALARPMLLVGRPGQAFLRHWPLALTGDVEGIHQARVATRRLREALPFLGRTARDRELRRVRTALRHLTRALGPSRELDVSRLRLADIGRRSPRHRVAVAAVDRRLATARREAGRVLQALGGGVDVAVLIARTRTLALRLESRPGSVAACAHRAEARLAARARALGTAVEAAGRVYASGPLHAVRISLKKFRYSFELAVQLGRTHHRGSVRRLKALQDVLGDMHDLQVLASLVRDAEGAVPPGQRPKFGALVSHLDEQIRRLHSRYVAERGQLGPVLARAMRLGQLLAAVAPAARVMAGPPRGRVGRPAVTGGRVSDAPSPQPGRRRPARRLLRGVS